MRVVFNKTFARIQHRESFIFEEFARGLNFVPEDGAVVIVLCDVISIHFNMTVHSLD